MKVIKKNTKNNKGVTIVSLVILVTILVLITTTITMNMNARYEAQQLDKLSSDLELLEDKVLLYYTQYGEYPIKDTPLNGQVYEIELSKLNGLTLNYGSKKEGEEDVYIIDISTGIISYQKGISYKTKRFYSLSSMEDQDIKGITILKIAEQSVEIRKEDGTLNQTIRLTKPIQTVFLKPEDYAILQVKTNLEEDKGILYQWYRNDKKIEGATQSSYEVQNSDEEGEGEDNIRYYCKVTYQEDKENNQKEEQYRDSNVVVISVEK